MNMTCPQWYKEFVVAEMNIKAKWDGSGYVLMQDGVEVELPTCPSAAKANDLAMQVFGCDVAEYV